MDTSFQSMRFAILLAVFMVYLVMASQFESLLHPFVILFSVPFSLVGVILALWAFGVTVSVVVLIGVIMLAGIVVNNAILLLDTTNRLRRAGAAKLDALREAGRARLRPILMTTSTTVLGLLPMAIGLGEGAELRTPMAIAVIGGLVLSTALTLLVIPPFTASSAADLRGASPTGADPPHAGLAPDHEKRRGGSEAIEIRRPGSATAARRIARNPGRSSAAPLGVRWPAPQGAHRSPAPN